MTSREEQEYAYLLFAKNTSLEQIAERVGKHPNTITRWRKKYKWDETRETLLTSKHEQLRMLYLQLGELQAHIMEKPEGKRFANKSEADALIQITKSIANLEKEISPGVVVDVFIPFIEFVAKQDGELAKVVIEYQDRYVKSLRK